MTANSIAKLMKEHGYKRDKSIRKKNESAWHKEYANGVKGTIKILNGCTMMKVESPVILVKQDQTIADLDARYLAKEQNQMQDSLQTLLQKY
jgi:hypothetical protein